MDIHSHILPGVDDGAADIAEALAIAERAVANGVSVIAATPHFAEGFFRPEAAVIAQRLEELRSMVRTAGLSLQVMSGAEVRISPSLLSWLKRGEVPTLGDNRFLLLELPFDCIPRQSSSVVSELAAQGITSVLAHVERNIDIQRDPAKLSDFLEQGCLVQVNSTSLTGSLGHSAQVTACTLLKTRQVHVIASDSHDAKNRYPNFKEAHRMASDVVGPAEAVRMLRDTPSMILGVDDGSRGLG